MGVAHSNFVIQSTSSMTRRQFTRTVTRLATLGFATGVYAWRLEPYWVEYVRRTLPIENLPSRLIGQTLIQISDLHIGERVDPFYMLPHFKQIAESRPAIVVYTGDFVSFESARQLDQLQWVMAHAPLGRLGTLAIMGNHDYGKNWLEQDVCDAISEILTARGITVLSNENHWIAGLNIIGLDDLWGPNFNPTAALNCYRPAAANLVLCHNPDVCDLNVWQNYRGWILAGHTHGGQCKPPFLPPPILPVKNKRYTEGEFDVGQGRRLYINRALGSSWPVRFNVRPEITVFTLASEDHSPHPNL